MTIKVCKVCKFYKAPSIFALIFSRSIFLEKCMHKEAVNEIDGSPTPCVTMRINKCQFGRLYEPNSVE